MKQRKAFLTLILLAIIICMTGVFSFQNMAKADPAWLSDWGFRKSIEITENNGEDLTNYQVKFDVNYGSGADSGSSVYLDSNCSTDFSDIRFTGDDGDTLLDYWIEEFTASGDASIWVKIPSILDSATATAYIYYGNNGVSTISNGTENFPFFDHFLESSLNTTKWDEVGTVSVSSSEVNLDNDDKLLGKTAFGYDYAIHARCKADEQDIIILSFADGDALENTNELWISNTDVTYPNVFNRFLARSKYPVGATDSYYDGDDFRDTYYVYQIKRISGEVKYCQGDTLLTTRTTHLPTVDLFPHFAVWDSSQESTLTVDWVFVRKHVDSEPTITDWGSVEETPPPPPPPETNYTPIGFMFILVAFVTGWLVMGKSK